MGAWLWWGGDGGARAGRHLCVTASMDQHADPSLRRGCSVVARAPPRDGPTPLYPRTGAEDGPLAVH